MSLSEMFSSEDASCSRGSSAFRRAEASWRVVSPRSSAAATASRGLYASLNRSFPGGACVKARAVAVFKEGRDAGGDVYLFMTSAAKVADQPPPGPGQPGDGGAAETPDGRNTRNDNRPAAQSR